MINYKKIKLYYWFKNRNFYLFLYSIFSNNKYYVASKSTRLIVEGYPRTANTFAYNIFEKSFGLKNLNANCIAHHVHSSSQLIFGAKNDIPVILLIRNPIDSISSMLIKFHEFENEDSCIEWIKLYSYYYYDFYYRLLKFKNQFLIVKFESIINDYTNVIVSLNNKFDTSFPIIQNSQNQTKEILDKIKNDNLVKVGNNLNKLAIPNSNKDIKKEAYYDLITSHGDLEKLNHIYKLFISFSV